MIFFGGGRQGSFASPNSSNFHIALDPITSQRIKMKGCNSLNFGIEQHHRLLHGTCLSQQDPSFLQHCYEHEQYY